MLGGSERDSFDARERRRVGYWETRKGLDTPAGLGPVRVARADASSPVADVCVGQVRAAQMEAMASRSEVQHMLQQSLLDVKQQIAARRILVTPTTAATTTSLDVQNPPHTQKPPTHSTCSSTSPPDTSTNKR